MCLHHYLICLSFVLLRWLSNSVFTNWVWGCFSPHFFLFVLLLLLIIVQLWVSVVTIAQVPARENTIFVCCLLSVLSGSNFNWIHMIPITNCFLYSVFFLVSFFLNLVSLAELLWWEAFTTGKDAMDWIQPGAGVWYRIHYRLPGGEAGREPQQEPDAAGEGHFSCHHQNGGGAFLLVRDQGRSNCIFVVLE